MGIVNLSLTRGEITDLVAANLGAILPFKQNLEVPEDAVTITGHAVDDEGELDTIDFEIDLNLVREKRGEGDV